MSSLEILVQSFYSDIKIAPQVREARLWYRDQDLHDFTSTMTSSYKWTHKNNLSTVCTIFVNFYKAAIFSLEFSFETPFG